MEQAHHHSIRRRSDAAAGFTLLEMLATVAVLVIVLGLMMSLARYVRNELAVQVTKDLLHKLDGLMQQYAARHPPAQPGGPGPLAGFPPFIAPDLPPDKLPDEATLQHNAEANNRAIVLALRQEGLLGDESFNGLPQSIYNDAVIRDAWGSPIVFMPGMHEGIGMAPRNQPFFFSAGPDQQYLTQENNLYSYER